MPISLERRLGVVKRLPVDLDDEPLTDEEVNTAKTPETRLSGHRQTVAEHPKPEDRLRARFARAIDAFAGEPQRERVVTIKKALMKGTVDGRRCVLSRRTSQVVIE